MVPRRLESQLKGLLRQFPAVALLGPRQVGKTTLARTLKTLEWHQQPPLYLDLEDQADRAKLQDPKAYLQSHQHRLVILDEVQRAPQLFESLRGLIDERRLAGDNAAHFLILGSASIELLKQSSESLAGRIAFLELPPFDPLELPQTSIETLWLRGGFPSSTLAINLETSITWRDAFISTYLERDIPQLGPRIAAESLRRLWTMLAHLQGSLLNAANLARNLGVDSKTVASYIDLLVDLLLVRRLPPLLPNVGKRITKSPKIYVRDSGLVHALLHIDNFERLLEHPVVGASWEGFVLENLLRLAPSRAQAYHYRTATGVELDLILELPGNRRWAIEIKRTSAPKLSKGFYTALEDVRPEKSFVIYNGKESYPLGENIQAISLQECCSVLWTENDANRA